MEGDKVVYTHTSQEVQQKLKELGTLISQVLAISECSKTESYQILQRVFNEQYEMNDDKIIVARDKETISPQSVQSPFDTDCTYRSKGGHGGQKEARSKRI